MLVYRKMPIAGLVTFTACQTFAQEVPKVTDNAETSGQLSAVAGTTNGQTQTTVEDNAAMTDDEAGELYMALLGLRIGRNNKDVAAWWSEFKACLTCMASKVADFLGSSEGIQWEIEGGSKAEGGSDDIKYKFSGTTSGDAAADLFGGIVRCVWSDQP